MSRLLLLGPARDAVGERVIEVDGTTVEEVIAAAVTHYGQRFADIVASSTLWVNGESADHRQSVGPDDEIAVLPPVSGG